MNNSELLKNARNSLLKLHKALVDFERETFVAFNGATTPTAFLGQLLENPDLAWLRRFSTLIVDIDEMFAQKDGFTQAGVDAHLQAAARLVKMDGESEAFRTRYELALQNDREGAAYHAELKQILDAVVASEKPD